MRILIGCAVAVVAVMAAAITFPGGNMPHQVDVGNGETALAYHNGIVYATDRTCGGMFNKCTLWREEDGTVTQSFSVIFAGRGYTQAQMRANPVLTAKWERAQAALSNKN